ncbi:MAG: hypothetical protein PVJ42_03605 [bacterium]|jgi:hypothetical protein
MGKSIARRRYLLVWGLVLVGLFILAGCEDDEGVRPDINRPPETSLAVAPRPGTEVFHKYQVNWVGTDRDGVVERYRIATMPEEELYGGLIDPEDIQAFLFDILFDPDNPGSTWFETDTTESLFVFSADSPNSKKHSLYISAVDNEGKLDLSPAATNFMAIDFGLPQIEIYISSNVDPDWKVPPSKGDTLPAYNEGSEVEVRVKWEGYDPDGDIAQWQYRLDSSAVRSRAAGAPGPDGVYRDSLTFVYDPDDPLGSDVWIGYHEFKLVAIDDANARSDDYLARFIINYDPDTYVDSVWAFRVSKQDTVPEVLIYPTDGAQQPVWHFGRVRFKFHGTDRDKFPDTEVSPEYFTWRVKGTVIYSSPTWLSKPTGEYIGGQPVYADTIPAAFSLDTDAPLELLIRARDELGTIDGTPASLVFAVNYSPEIGNITWEQTGLGTVLFEWESSDPDEDYGWGPSGIAALINYRYRIDKGPWRVFDKQTDLDPITKHFVKFVEVEDLEPGDHTFTLQAYNKDYFTSRSDEMIIDFHVD